MPESALTRASRVLTSTPALANSFSADPIKTLERLGFNDLDAKEIQILASLSPDDITRLGSIITKVQLLDPKILVGHSGAIIF